MRDKSPLILFLLIPIVGFCILLMFMMFIFSFLNQSPNDKEQLTLINFALPWLFTIVLMIYGMILSYKKPTKFKKVRIMLFAFLIMELISIPYQVKYIEYAFVSGGHGFEDIFPISVALILITYMFIELIRIYKRLKRQTTE